MSMRIFKSIILLCVFVFGVFSVNAFAAGERIVLISHAPDSDSWWNSVKNGLKLARAQLKIRTEYRNSPTGDIAEMARIVEQVVASRPAGIIVPISDYDVLKGPISKAVNRGIPVITINSGTHEQSEKLGALMHVGQPEYDAGFGAGKRSKANGVQSFLCVNHYMTNPASVDRCQGFADAVGVGLGKQMIDSGQDPSEIKNKVIAYLKTNPNTDAILTLGPTSAHPTIKALEQMGNLGAIYFGTFDLSEEIAKHIKAGNIQWAIDQQPFLQSYLPTVLLTNLVRYGVIPANHINTGPGFITKQNIGLVETYAGVYR